MVSYFNCVPALTKMVYISYIYLLCRHPYWIIFHCTWQSEDVLQACWLHYL